MLCNTDASLRQVRSAMSSCLSYFGGFIFCRSSLGTNIFFDVSCISTSTSSPRAFLVMEPATKPCCSWGTHTRRFWDHSAWVAGSEKEFLSTTRNFRSGSFLSTSAMLFQITRIAKASTLVGCPGFGWAQALTMALLWKCHLRLRDLFSKERERGIQMVAGCGSGCKRRLRPVPGPCRRRAARSSRPTAPPRHHVTSDSHERYTLG